MRPPSKGWYTHDEQIRAELDNLRKALNEARSRGMSDVVNNKYPNINKVSELDNLRKALNEARSRGMSDVVNNKYPNINKVSELQPPKSTDAKVPKICQ